MKASEYKQRLTPQPEAQKFISGRQDPPEPKKW
jgi:hypothetical protein